MNFNLLFVTVLASAIQLVFSQNVIDPAVDKVLTAFHRLYNHPRIQHHYHSDTNVVFGFVNQGYLPEGVMGKIVDLDDYEKASQRIKTACPELMKLRVFIHLSTQTQFMTTKAAEADSRLASGWVEIKSAGYCVKKNTCGAKKRLDKVEVRSGYSPSNIVYSTVAYEMNELNTIERYLGTKSEKPICWLF